MNVLIFVMTMLMLLSLLTYARLESYRNSQVFQIFFTYYMEKDERGYQNLAAEKLYKKIKAPGKKTSEEPSPATLPAASNPKKNRTEKPGRWKRNSTDQSQFAHRSKTTPKKLSRVDSNPDIIKESYENSLWRTAFF